MLKLGRIKWTSQCQKLPSHYWNIKSKRPHTGEYLEAIKIYNEITRLYPDTIQAEEAMLRHGLTLTLYGFYTDAIKVLEDLLLVDQILINQNILIGYPPPFFLCEEKLKIGY